MTTFDTTVIDRWLAAEQDGDTDALRDLLSDDFTAIGPRGFVLDRDGWLERHAPGALRYTSTALTERTEQQVAGATLVTGALALEGAYGEHPLDERLRVTIVGAGDRIARVQMSPIAGPPAG